MQVKTRTATVHTHYIEIDGVEYETYFQADEYIDPKVEVTDDLTTITYAVLDTDRIESPIEDCDGIEWEEFRDSESRDEFAQELIEQGMHVFVVDHFEHSLSVYRPLGLWADERFNPGIDRWDSRPSVILGLASDFTDPLTAAQTICKEYTAWSQGEVYGIVQETYDAEGAPVGDHDACWGFIGVEYVEQTIKDGAF